MRRPSDNDPSVVAARFINQTDKCVFLTGKAGTGKTTFLRDIIRRTHKRAVIVAPTGIAAINAGGVTIHSQFQLPFGAFLPIDTPPLGLPPTSVIHNRHSLKMQMRLQATRRKVLSRLELLIIDEVSMLRADVLDAIDTTLRIVRHTPFTPFGGVQVLFIGDLMQLPPVVKNEEWDILRGYYKSPFFFDAHALADNPPLYIELEKIYRQADDRFIGILNNLRHNRIENTDMAILNQYYKPDFKPKPEEGYIHLTTHNAKAAELNESSLQALQGTTYTFNAEIDKDFPEFMYPTDKTLTLKIGAQVMFLKNDPSGEQKYFNGKIATVDSIKTTEQSTEITVKFNDSNQTLLLEKYEWKNIRFNVDEVTKEIEEEVIGTFLHYPIKLAWAITVHKSQGLTFEKAVVDVGGAFAAGQIYVALSRLTSLDGLILSSKISFRGISNDVQVERYAATKPDGETVNQLLEAGTQAFIRESILKAYSFSQLNFTWRQHLEGYNKSEQNSEKQKHTVWGLELFDKMTPLSNFAEKFIIQLKQQLDANAIDWVFLNKRLGDSRDYFAKEFGIILLKILMHKERMSLLPKTKIYVEELGELEAAMYSQFQQFHKAAVLVKCVVDNTEITKEIFEEALSPQHRYKMLQAAKDNVAFESPKPVTSPKNSPKTDRAGERKEWDDEFNPLKMKPAKAPKVSKAAKATALGLSETQQTTYDMFKSGHLLAAIASERHMTMGTIYSHFMVFVGKGLVDVRKIMSADRYETILQAFEGLELGNSIIPAKEKLGNDFSYEEIRLARAAQRFEGMEDVAF
jgi:PIF1-like helicase/Helix-turn-helix domain/Helicase